jgi:hypothetical protein
LDFPFGDVREKTFISRRAGMKGDVIHYTCSYVLRVCSAASKYMCGHILTEDAEYFDLRAMTKVI